MTPDEVVALEAAARADADAGRWDAAATRAIQGYGPELYGYVAALARDPHVAEDVFATACARLWRGLPRFGWRSQLRTWAYTIARNTFLSDAGRTRRAREAPLSATAAAGIAAAIRTGTASYFGSTAHDALAAARAALDPDDQTLLILRVDRRMAWREIAAVLSPADASPEEIGRKSAALRKRLERLKADLKVAIVAYKR
ncbi:MAG TPA: sigma-70 family RNA polymerase sigma factor [Kofleriaceae bacterium]